MTGRAPVALVGAGGRMGKAVEIEIARSADFLLSCRADPSLASDAGPPRAGPNLDLVAPGEVAGIIDFSSPAGVVSAARAAERLGCPLVSGTTSIDAAGRDLLKYVSRSVAVCWSPNFSVGIPLLLAALREAAARLPEGWQIEIAETHHAAKRDAPSGTALRLAESWREIRGGVIVHGRQGDVGPRKEGEIGLHALRLGDVVGEHRILLGGSGEVLEYVHRMQDRSAFAAGSMEALRRLMRQGPGWYEWGDLLCRA